MRWAHFPDHLYFLPPPPPREGGGGGAEKQRQQEGQKSCVVGIVLGLRFRIFAKVFKKYFRTLAKKQKKFMT